MSLIRPRRDRVPPPELPPWWGQNGAPARVPGNSTPSYPPARYPRQRPDPRPDTAEHPAPSDQPGDSGPDPAPAPHAPLGAHDVETGEELDDEPAPGQGDRPDDGSSDYDASDTDPDGDPVEDWPVELEEPDPAARQVRQPLPAGWWTAEDESTQQIWMPDPVPGAFPHDPAPAPGTTSPVPARRESRPDTLMPENVEQDVLAASRPADLGSPRIRTTVDRPVAALRPVGLDEARQLAECFALDYMSCDEDDPQLRQLALAPYLARRADATLGWPGEHSGVGRQRAIHARAGECLAQGRWVTVDVAVLVEVYERHQRDSDPPTQPPEPTEDTPGRRELPTDARWSALPPAHAAGWTCSMTVWHRLGIPIRRHDSGHLVVELFTVSEPEA